MSASEWMIVGVGALLLTVPGNWAVRAILAAARRAPPPLAAGAGRWIGALERLLIFSLVVAGEPAAAGLVVAAKTILRFPEITGDPARIDPEYVLVGSLASWLLAFGVGLGVASMIR